MNIWTGDGYKDIPADRMGPRMRYKESIEEILSELKAVQGMGYKTLTVDTSEYRKLDGGLSCLSLRF